MVAVLAGCRERSEPVQKTEESAPPTGKAEVRSGEPAKAPTPPSPTADQQPAPKLPPFEGELEVDVRGKAPESLHYSMKGDKIRLGLGGTPGKAGKRERGIDAIIDTDDQKATILLNERKEYVEVDLARLASKAQRRVEEMDVERTGKTSTVAGKTCEEWKIRDRDVRVSACVYKGAPYFDLEALERQGNFTAPPWVHRIVDAGYVPLRVSIADAAGKQLGSSEITDVSRKVDPTKFEIPKGYKRIEPSK